jgi:hypothetical protein
MNIDRLTEMLAVIEPLEGLSHAGTVAVFDAHWKTANRYAATEVSKMFPMFLDTIGWMLPGIIRVFSASDRIAEYEPFGPGDDEFAKQATDYCNYVFWKDNNGYRTLWDATHDSLLLGNGIVKHWWDDKEECEYSELSGLTAEQIAILQQEQGVEVTAQKAGEPQIVMMPDPRLASRCSSRSTFLT